MPGADAAIQQSMASDTAVSDWLALIASPDAHKGIVEVLERDELSFRAFPDMDALLGQPSKHSPSLVVLSLEDSISELLGCTDQLARRFAKTPVVLVCSGIERWEVRRALAAGVAGVVLSGDLHSTLGPCLQAVQGGQTCVPREHSRQIQPPVLSSREKQVLGLVVMGYMNSQIAGQLYLAESTIKSHLSSAFGKLGVRSRNEAVSLILDPTCGLGMGILELMEEPLESTPAAVQ
jgi:DNA-binding NarL/FixJ family response regulator